MKMNKNKFQKGFTLIELIVVIAIIGILAAVLLVNFTSTRNRAKNATIRLEMSQIRTAVESFFFRNSTYVGSCVTDNGTGTTDCDRLMFDIESQQTGTGDDVTRPTSPFTTTNWCVMVALNTPDGSWCVDATGYIGAPTLASDCATTDLTCR